MKYTIAFEEIEGLVELQTNFPRPTKTETNQAWVMAQAVADELDKIFENAKAENPGDN